MAGHSKWSNIKQKKGLADASRAKVFQKIAKELYIAAKGTNGVVSDNPALRVVVEKAKSNNMPKDNIEKAIEKAVGGGSNEHYDEIRYEGYGPEGVAIIIDCLSDNRNRTAMLVRSTLTKKGGNLGTDGSVAYMFSRKGVIVIDKVKSEDEIMINALDNGAIDIIVNDDNYEIYTNPEDLLKVRDGLESIGIKDFAASEITFAADNYIELNDEKRDVVIELIEALEDIDDVQNVYHNLSM